MLWRVQSQEAREGVGCLLALDIWIVFAGFQEPVVSGIGRVVLQHIKNELLLDCLTHRVAVNGLALPAEDRERLVFGRRSEGEEAQIRLFASLRHAPE